MRENPFRGAANRILQLFAQYGPGATSFRIVCHRLRGVQMGKNVWIGHDVLLETSKPYLIRIGSNVSLSMRVTIIAHYREMSGVTIEDEVFVGPGVIVMPNVTIGRGAVVTAGSVVTHSVTPMTVVQGNPARPIARCTKPMTLGVSLKEFTKGLRPLPRRGPPVSGESLSEDQEGKEGFRSVNHVG